MSDPQRQTAEMILHTIPGVMRTIAGDLRRRGIVPVPAHLGILIALAERPRSLGELADLHAVSPPTMSSSIHRLVSKGWLHCERDPQDRRRLLIHLTEEGWTVLSEIHQRAQEVVLERLKTLSPEACAHLIEGLRLLQQVFVGGSTQEREG
ncbi:MAG: MarR family transcriptional regulator [Chloroflexi bacterium]|nr:MarR family transcriptional regulator [Chloroflexota bacterium]